MGEVQTAARPNKDNYYLISSITHNSCVQNVSLDPLRQWYRISPPSDALEVVVASKSKPRKHARGEEEKETRRTKKQRSEANARKHKLRN